MKFGKSVFISRKTIVGLSEHTRNNEIFNKREEKVFHKHTKEKICFLEWKEMMANNMVMVHWMPADNPNVIKGFIRRGNHSKADLG